LAAPPEPTYDSLLSGIRRHLDGLKGTRDGLVLYNLIERGLKRYGETGRIERAFVNFVTTLLGRYAKDPAYDASTRIKARLIQQRLSLHLASAEQGAVPAANPPPAPVTSTVSAAPIGNPPPLKPSVDTAPPRKSEAPASSEPEWTKRAAALPKEPDVPIQVLEQELVERVTETLASEGALASPTDNDISNKLSEFGDLKDILIKGLDELVRERHALIRRIEGATGYLKALEHDRRRLNEELAKVRKHSSVDELTGLPKRDIFVRTLEAEVGRVRRYGFSFALALIDVDGFRSLNDKYGRDGGDAVLRCYGTEILSRFRAYDLVSRYGDDEFAILFPNTQKDGALRALEKAQKSAASMYVTCDGQNIRLPTFSSVLAVYIQGEKPAQLLKRAAEALDNARLHGNNQIVVSVSSG
jgi:diguanylate cyclase